MGVQHHFGRVPGGNREVREVFFDGEGEAVDGHVGVGLAGGGVGEDFAGGKGFVLAGEGVVVLEGGEAHGGEVEVAANRTVAGVNAFCRLGDGEGDRAEMLLLFDVEPAFGKGIMDGIIEQPVVPFRRRVEGVVKVVVEGQFHLDFIRILRVDDVPDAGVKGDGSGDGDQHHRREDADIGHADGVLLHPEEEAGDGGKGAGLIVKGLLLPQEL